jgi:hypothetical protein
MLQGYCNLLQQQCQSWQLRMCRAFMSGTGPILLMVTRCWDGCRAAATHTLQVGQDNFICNNDNCFYSFVLFLQDILFCLFFQTVHQRSTGHTVSAAGVPVGRRTYPDG